jgi:predicted amidophosphoribosyltransferase
VLAWLLLARCPLCGGDRYPSGAPTVASSASEAVPPGSGAPCGACAARLQLPAAGLSGDDPLPWWAAGSYDGALRHQLLRLRARPHGPALAALAATIQPALPGAPQRPLLVPVPSWKRRANPLPALLCRRLGHRLGLGRADLLARAHPVLGQHHLRRSLRFANQRGSFVCRRLPQGSEARRRPLLLVDDILTSGATALAAAEALQRGGWKVAGLLCLARTPAQRGVSDLHWRRRRGDRPG